MGTPEHGAHEEPFERLKLLSGSDDEVASYLDSIEVSSPREREMLTEISRTAPLVDPGRFPVAHRNVVEALESLARHGYRGSRAGARVGPLRMVVRFGVELVARYVVVSYIRSLTTSLRNLYGLREAQAVPSSQSRLELHRARVDAERMVDALKQRELGIPTFLIGGAIIPVAASIGRATGLLRDFKLAGIVGAVGVLVALLVSWLILRGTAMASRRIRLATRGPVASLWAAIGHCGNPPRDQSRKFVIAAIVLTLGSWIIVPLFLAIAFAI
ncbi:MAG: hypothetical protein U0R50_09690 [Gaiellales bacterium]